MEEAYESAKKITTVRNRDWLDSPWDDFFRDKNPFYVPPTGIDKENLEQIVMKFSQIPEGFNLHRGLERTLKGYLFLKIFQCCYSVSPGSARQ